MKLNMQAKAFLAVALAAIPATAVAQPFGPPVGLQPRQPTGELPPVIQIAPPEMPPAKEDFQFNKDYGLVGARALERLPEDVARRLVLAHAKGLLAKLPDPYRLVELIAEKGEPVARWALDHLGALTNKYEFYEFINHSELYVPVEAPAPAAGAASGKPLWEREVGGVPVWVFGAGLGGLAVAALVKRRRGGSE